MRGGPGLSESCCRCLVRDKVYLLGKARLSKGEIKVITLCCSVVQGVSVVVFVDSVKL